MFGSTLAAQGEHVHHWSHQATFSSPPVQQVQMRSSVPQSYRLCDENGLKYFNKGPCLTKEFCDVQTFRHVFCNAIHFIFQDGNLFAAYHANGILSRIIVVIFI